jgi:hypothetical protein
MIGAFIFLAIVAVVVLVILRLSQMRGGELD